MGHIGHPLVHKAPKRTSILYDNRHSEELKEEPYIRFAMNSVLMRNHIYGSPVGRSATMDYIIWNGLLTPSLAP